MSACYTSKATVKTGDAASDRFAHRHYVVATVNDDLIAAVEGWRMAHGLADQSEALGELVRLGLMSEIAKIYRMVSENRALPTEKVKGSGERKAKRDRQSREPEHREHPSPANSSSVN